jgi:gas vesicle protein
MGKEPEVIENDIEATREDLSRNLDALADRVSPGKVVGRQVDGVKSSLTGAKDKVFGSAQSAGGSITDAPSQAASAVTDRAEGNPLAAGLIAFGAGWLISSLIPASEKETQLAGQAVDLAKEHGQPLVDHAKSVGQDIGEDLKSKATDAASELKESAQESAQHVKDEGQSAAQSVKDDAQG